MGEVLSGQIEAAHDTQTFTRTLIGFFRHFPRMGHQKDTQQLVNSRSLPIDPIRILGVLNHNLGVSQTDQHYVVLWPLWSSLWPKLSKMSGHCKFWGNLLFHRHEFLVDTGNWGFKKLMFRHIQIINSWWYIPLYHETYFRYGSLMLVISSIIIIIQDVQPSTVTPQKLEHIYTVLVGVFFLF